MRISVQEWTLTDSDFELWVGWSKLRNKEFCNVVIATKLHSNVCENPDYVRTQWKLRDVTLGGPFYSPCDVVFIRLVIFCFQAFRQLF